MAVKISKVLKNGSGLNIEWTDGKKSNFNFMWLRDNCPLDMDEDTRERTFNILEVSENIHTKEYKINPEGKHTPNKTQRLATFKSFNSSFVF